MKVIYKKQLTIIIPFLNEKKEIANTVKSIRNYSKKDQIEIILINDASDDGFDYEEVSKIYRTQYILNKKRIGVAASRDLGVMSSKTPFVMFLDAHMRFYNDLWVERIIKELNSNPKTLLCCQTQGLAIIGNKLIKNKKRPVSFGASIDLSDEKNFLECHWLFSQKEDDKNLDTISIPCVLGAAYACTKEYWLHLKGLEGLMYYGNDESYISMKVWLEGGECKLLKDIVVGHIYRDFPPYKIENAPRLYNRLLIAELLLPEYYKSRFFSLSKHYYTNIFKYAIEILYKNKHQICFLKEYYKRILKKEFSYYEKVNNQLNTPDFFSDKKDLLLRKIINYIVLNNGLLQEIGLLNGKFGIAILLFHYAQYSKNDAYTQLAELILDNIVENIDLSCSIIFYNGLSGIGWGIEYLYQNNFIDGDTNEILEVIDNKIMEINLETIDSLNLNNGLGGILNYILARLYTVKQEKRTNPFKHDYLLKLYKKAKKTLNHKENCDCIEIFVRYLLFYERISTIKQPTIYDITCLIIPKDYQIDKFVIGLDGSAGVGLKLIFENFKL